MAAYQELIERVETIFRHPANDVHGLQSQIKTLAETVVEITKHHHLLEENVSAIGITVHQLVAVVKAFHKQP
jgi:hypothetical protein